MKRLSFCGISAVSVDVGKNAEQSLTGREGMGTIRIEDEFVRRIEKNRVLQINQ